MSCLHSRYESNELKLLQNLSFKQIIDDILIQENIYSLIEGYLCSFQKEEEDTSVVAAYVTVNSQFTEKDFKNAIYVNVILL